MQLGPETVSKSTARGHALDSRRVELEKGHRRLGGRELLSDRQPGLMQARLRHSQRRPSAVPTYLRAIVHGRTRRRQQGE